MGIIKNSSLCARVHVYVCVRACVRTCVRACVCYAVHGPVCIVVKVKTCNTTTVVFSSSTVETYTLTTSPISTVHISGSTSVDSGADELWHLSKMSFALHNPFAALFISRTYWKIGGGQLCFFVLFFFPRKRATESLCRKMRVASARARSWM